MVKYTIYRIQHLIGEIWNNNSNQLTSFLSFDTFDEAVKHIENNRDSFNGMELTILPVIYVEKQDIVINENIIYTPIFSSNILRDFKKEELY